MGQDAPNKTNINVGDMVSVTTPRQDIVGDNLMNNITF